MKEVFRMWKYTRMVVLTALVAALYASILIPFKVAIPLIPGFTEFRPASVIPIISSIFFGPAACWGSAIGNFIGDWLGGTLGIGSTFGIIGNFLYGFIPYKVFRIISKSEPLMRTWRDISKYVLICFIASLVCAVVIGWGVDLLGLVPFAALGNIIFVNNFVVASILGPLLVGLLYPRMKSWGILYDEIMDKEDIGAPKFSILGIILLFVGALSGIILGNIISVGAYDSAFMAFGFGKGVTSGLGIALGLLPSILLIFISVALL